MEQGEQANWSERLCAFTGLLGQEATHHIMELGIEDKEDPLRTRDMVPAQNEIGAKTVNATELADKVQVPPQGPLAIKQRAIVAQQTVAGGIAARLARTSGFQQALKNSRDALTMTSSSYKS
jgi:hypothetical protein